ncbi:MAG: hypothetical protein MI741_06135 [Rhodospirillales bacterium]|nr:hypothetical protein [Rhodospirillales bacterium]
MSTEPNPLPDEGDMDPGTAPSGWRKLVRALWRGERPLWEVFWWYTMVFGTLLNLLTTIGFFFLVYLGAPYLVAIAEFALPIPYNIFMVVAVWRSAGNYSGPPIRAQLAQAFVVIWSGVASVT